MANVTLGAVGHSKDRYALLSPTLAHYYTSLILITPGGKPYTPFEKLYLPFSTVLWIYVGNVFALGLIVIFMLKFVNQPTRDFVFGLNNRMPVINMFNAFLGGGISNEPTRTFARSLLLIWMLATLVLRNSYQGFLFSFLQGDQTGPKVEGIDKIIEQNFSVYLEPTAHYIFQYTPEIHKQ